MAVVVTFHRNGYEAYHGLADWDRPAADALVSCIVRDRLHYLNEGVCKIDDSPSNGHLRCVFFVSLEGITVLDFVAI
jgi:hypothetical protein